MDWYVRTLSKSAVWQPPNDQDMTWTGPDVAQDAMTLPGAAEMPTKQPAQPPWKRKKRRPLDTTKVPMRMDGELPPATSNPLQPDPWLGPRSSY